MTTETTANETARTGRSYPILDNCVVIEQGALDQMADAMSRPCTVHGCLMPDAHQGYGLPIGGVWLTRNTIVPYAVGVDIGCTVCLTEFDYPWSEDIIPMLRSILERCTRFGVGQGWKDASVGPQTDFTDDGHLNHWVCQAELRAELEDIVRDSRKFPGILDPDKVRTQAGTSGSGNHFAEFGYTTGSMRLALVTHSGSRGSGAAVCNHYTRLAKQMNPDMPSPANNLAGLPMRSRPEDPPLAGDEYYDAMRLMARYAALNHEMIHRKVARAMEDAWGCRPDPVRKVVTNHNIAEAWDDRELRGTMVLHRKGATPLYDQRLSYIPGTMRDPGYVVRAKPGSDQSHHLWSASHGAGRAMSRTKARERFTEFPEDGPTLLSAGMDEHPDAYKDIRSVMESQVHLVQVVDMFVPTVVRMAPDNEKPED